MSVPLTIPEGVVLAWARETYRQDLKCGNGDYDTNFDALPYEERESRLCEAEMNALFVASQLEEHGWKRPAPPDPGNPNPDSPE